MSSAPRDAVVDASVAVKWHLTDEEDAEKAGELLAQFIAGEVNLAAPRQIRYEVPAAISVATRTSPPRLTVEQGEAAIKEFLELGLQCADDQELLLSAYAVVHRYGCAFYDALYLALAQRLAVPLITADRKLYRLIGHLPAVVWIGDYGKSPPEKVGASER